MEKYFYKNLLLSITLILGLSEYLTAQIQDNVIDDPGDIAIVAYYAPGSGGGISFVLLDNCPNGTSIKFTDEEWIGSGFASATGEGDITWTNSGSTILRGSVVHINATSSFSSITCNLGSATMTDSGFGCTDNDQVYAYIGSRSSVTAWLTAYGSLLLTPAVMPPGLTNGTNAIIYALGGRYTGPTTCNTTAVACAQLINASANWTFNNSYTYPTQVVQSFNGSALPVEITRFEGNNKVGRSLLTWQTASESQNKGFDIERSTDGSRFEKIGFVAGKGTTSETQNYSFEDKSASGLVYYRLKQLDFDGRFEYSKIIAIDRKGENVVSVFPNPSKGIFTVTGIEDSEDETFTLINSIGQTLSINVQNKGQLDMSAFPSGVYYLRVASSGQVMKLVKE